MMIKSNFILKVLFLCSLTHNLGAQSGNEKSSNGDSYLHALVKLADGVIGEDGAFDHNAAELTIKVAVIVGLMQGVIKLFGDVIGNSFSAIMKKMPALWLMTTKLFFTGIDRLCGCVDPYDPQQIILLGSLFDNAMKALCSDVLPENCGINFKKDAREFTGEKQVQDFKWDFCRRFTGDVFSYIIKKLESGHYYYLAMHERSNKQGFFNKMVANFMLQDREAIIFISAALIENINHISDVCNQASGYESLDLHHLKILYLSTSHLFKKLNGLLQVQNKQDSEHTNSVDVIAIGSVEVL